MILQLTSLLGVFFALHFFRDLFVFFKFGPAFSTTMHVGRTTSSNASSASLSEISFRPRLGRSRAYSKGRCPLKPGRKHTPFCFRQIRQLLCTNPFILMLQWRHGAYNNMHPFCSALSCVRSIQNTNEFLQHTQQRRREEV